MISKYLINLFTGQFQRGGRAFFSTLLSEASTKTISTKLKFTGKEVV